MYIRQAIIEEYFGVGEHYALCGYRGGVHQDDLVFVAIEDQNIIGAVRICFENDEKVLRGMYIQPQFRNGGIGKAMLHFLIEHVDMADCYCLPYCHLQSFYGLIGFREIKTGEAPFFLAERLKSYAKSNRDPIIIMKRF
ncbi:MAG TPA: GNAT family N-acetyltransferase [Mucilaginibacter sp.]|jgi:predicted N-acetyltransferase YhbS|nr:GNAT family N-acetyltransferase [Mucilaginibacter sp.]